MKLFKIPQKAGKKHKTRIPKIKTPKTNSLKTKIKKINFQKIRFKLIGAFIVPVGLILLGFVSYSKASTGIIKNCEMQSETSLNMLIIL